MASAKVLIAFGDCHFPDQDPEAIALLLKAMREYRPALAISLGDLLDCKAFSTHEPDGSAPGVYAEEVKQANQFLDKVQKDCAKLVLVEGNHEHRITRFAHSGRAGAAAHSLISPQNLLMANRPKAATEYVAYGPDTTGYPHYTIQPGLIAVHGWSVSSNATRKHLDVSRGSSLIHGHTHRAAHCWVQDPYSDRHLEAVGAGCMCHRIPFYGVGTPVEWTRGFVVGYYGNGHQSLFFVPINGSSCVIPNGKELRV